MREPEQEPEREPERELEPEPEGQGRPGLTFLELVTVLAVAGMVMLAGHAGAHQAKKNAWRARARAALDQVYRTEILYCAVHGRFTDKFPALHSIGLPDPVDPIYRFSLDVPARTSFVCQGWANLDADTGVDSLLVDETGVVRSLARD